MKQTTYLIVARLCARADELPVVIIQDRGSTAQAIARRKKEDLGRSKRSTAKAPLNSTSPVKSPALFHSKAMTISCR